MTIYQRPDERVLAESARDGEIKDFPDIKRGWAVAFEQTGGIPPMEWFNALGKRSDEAIRYLMQRGIAEWSSSEEYPAGALVQHQGQFWLAAKNHHGIEPKINTIWQATALTVDQVKALMPISRVNGKTGDVQLTADDVGALTESNADNRYLQKHQLPVLSVNEQTGHVQLTAKDVGTLTSEQIYQEIKVQSVNGQTGQVTIYDVPVGIPQPWPAIQPPAGWLKCNGSSFDKNRYPLLAKAYPDGVLPDLRGEFVRGWDDGRGIDVGRGILSAQLFSTEAHQHQSIFWSIAGASINSQGIGANQPFGLHISASQGKDGRINMTSFFGAKETRPRNIAFLYIVRAA